MYDKPARAGQDHDPQIPRDSSRTSSHGSATDGKGAARYVVGSNCSQPATRMMRSPTPTVNNGVRTPAGSLWSSGPGFPALSMWGQRHHDAVHAVRGVGHGRTSTFVGARAGSAGVQCRRCGAGDCGPGLESAGKVVCSRGGGCRLRSWTARISASEAGCCRAAGGSRASRTPRAQTRNFAGGDNQGLLVSGQNGQQSLGGAVRNYGMRARKTVERLGEGQPLAAVARTTRR